MSNFGRSLEEVPRLLQERLIPQVKGWQFPQGHYPAQTPGQREGTPVRLDVRWWNRHLEQLLDVSGP